MTFDTQNAVIVKLSCSLGGLNVCFVIFFCCSDKTENNFPLFRFLVHALSHGISRYHGHGRYSESRKRHGYDTGSWTYAQLRQLPTYGVRIFRCSQQEQVVQRRDARQAGDILNSMCRDISRDLVSHFWMTLSFELHEPGYFALAAIDLKP